MPAATAFITLSRETDGCRSSGLVADFSSSQTPTASTMTKCVLCLASGVTLCKSSESMTRQPRPFICSKYVMDRMFRMNSRHSSGFTSVPVAIMSTVTAMRGL